MAGILIQKDPQNLVYKDVTAAQRLVWAQDFTIYDVNADGSKGAAYGPTVTRSEEGAITINSLDGLERGPDGAAVPWAAAAQALVSEAGISGATYDGSGRLTGYTRQGIAHVVSYPSTTTIAISNTLGTEREVTLDSAGRVLAIA